jgi:hypothetical protein
MSIKNKEIHVMMIPMEFQAMRNTSSLLANTTQQSLQRRLVKFIIRNRRRIKM